MAHIDITCPACAAKYQVPAAAIPAGGRDVQCAACGHNWYHLWSPVAEPVPQAGEGAGAGQARLDTMRAALRQVGTDAMAGVAPDGAEDQTSEQAAPGFGELPVPMLGRNRDVLGSRPTEPDNGGQGTAPSPPLPHLRPRLDTPPRPDIPPELISDEEPELDLPPPPPRRRLDPNVAAVLREEAAIETQARRRDMGLPLETQGELPLPPRPRRTPQEVRARLAALQAAERHSETTDRWSEEGETSTGAPMADPLPNAPPTETGFRPLPPVAEPGPAPRAAKMERDRSRIAGSAVGGVGRGDRSLPAPLSPRELAAIEEQKVRRGFQIGFGIPVAAAALVLTVFLSAPALMDRVPGAAPVITQLMDHGERLQTELAFGVRDMVRRMTGTP